MHGRHQTLVATIAGGVASGPHVSGEVRCSLVAPNTATTGVPTAPARCMAPESLEITASACAITPASSARVVRPDRSTSALFWAPARVPTDVAISAHAG